MAGLFLGATALLLIGVTYVLYPILHGLKKQSPVLYPEPEHWPHVTIVFAAFNEEGVLNEKLERCVTTSYPKDRLEILVGSDCSADDTDAIVQRWSAKYPFIRLHRNVQRSGKSATINSLVEQAKGTVIVATDANIMFQPDTLKELIRPIAAGAAEASAGQLVYGPVPKGENTAKTEALYLGLENKIRASESARYGFCLGMEGGLYAIRKAFWTPIPPNTFMEDFFQTVALIRQKRKIVFQQSALGYEDISTALSEEYKRKIRISIGNFQNLKRFFPLLLTQPYPFGWAFLAHKVLRWLTPHLYLLAILGFALSPYYLPAIAILLGLPLAQLLAYRFGLTTPLAYFYAMNAALFVGFLRYLKGVNSSAWQPTKRKQYES